MTLHLDLENEVLPEQVAEDFVLSQMLFLATFGAVGDLFAASAQLWLLVAFAVGANFGA